MIYTLYIMWVSHLHCTRITSDFCFDFISLIDRRLSPFGNYLSTKHFIESGWCRYLLDERSMILRYSKTRTKMCMPRPVFGVIGTISKSLHNLNIELYWQMGVAKRIMGTFTRQNDREPLP